MAVGSTQYAVGTRRSAPGNGKKGAAVRAIAEPGKRKKGVALAVSKAKPEFCRAKEVNPEEVIPMANDGIKDF